MHARDTSPSTAASLLLAGSRQNRTVFHLLTRRLHSLTQVRVEEQPSVRYVYDSLRCCDAVTPDGMLALLSCVAFTPLMCDAGTPDGRRHPLPTFNFSQSPLHRFSMPDSYNPFRDPFLSRAPPDAPPALPGPFDFTPALGSLQAGQSTQGQFMMGACSWSCIALTMPPEDLPAFFKLFQCTQLHQHPYNVDPPHA